MPGYPILLNLHHQRVVLIGGGRVAAHKINGLLDAGARVTVISPTLHPEIELSKIEYVAEGYQPGMLAHLQPSPILVFAATNVPNVNRAVAQEAESLGILVNVVDNPAISGFSSMAAVRRPPITIALATEGTSPALAAHLKVRIEQIISENDAVLARWLGDLRPLVKERITSQPARERFWQTLIESNAPALLHDGDINGAYNVVQELLKEA